MINFLKRNKLHLCCLTLNTDSQRKCMSCKKSLVVFFYMSYGLIFLVWNVSGVILEMELGV